MKVQESVIQKVKKEKTQVSEIKESPPPIQKPRKLSRDLKSEGKIDSSNTSESATSTLTKSKTSKKKKSKRKRRKSCYYCDNVSYKKIYVE